MLKWATWGCAIAFAVSACETTSLKDADAGTGDVSTTPVKSTHKIYVFDTIGFTRLDKDGHAPGFNLDGKVSDGSSDDGTCMQSDFIGTDGTPGIDNQFATLVPLIEATGISAVEKLLQASIVSGGILLLFELDGVDDLINDPEIHVQVRAAFGVPLLGTDGLLLTDQTFHVSPRDPNVNAGKAVLKDGWLTTAPFDIDLPVQVFGKDYTLEARNTLVRFHIVDDERIDQGILGAGVTISSVMAIAKKGAEDQGDILPIVESLVGGKGDLVKNAVTGECDQMSAALQFTGVAGFFFPADVTGTGK
jgi:hypothetical protein